MTAYNKIRFIQNTEIGSHKKHITFHKIINGNKNNTLNGIKVFYNLISVAFRSHSQLSQFLLCVLLSRLKFGLNTCILGRGVCLSTFDRDSLNVVRCVC